jgi:NAD(P)-dependent dehydrogenase (short-subunit alcohol dehydrogenase family)
MELAGKVAVVTGSGNGIGEAIARRFAAEGAKVVLTDIEPDGIERLAKEIGGVALAVDITVEENVRAVAELATTTFGRVDLWHSNAGFAGPREPGELQENSLWEMMWKLHVMSHVYAARAVLPGMIERGDGYLLQTASVVALSVQAEKAAYTVTKSAALALSEWLAVHNRPKGIKVSCFCPGPMLTRMLLSNEFPEDHPVLGMALTPDQVADVVHRGIQAEKFLILTQEGDDAVMHAKAEDYDAWLETAAPRIDDDA